MGKSGAATQLKRKDTNTPETTSDLSRDGTVEISSGLRQLLADVFALYVKTKNFDWHMSGRHFRDYHLLLDEHSEQVFAMTGTTSGSERARSAEPRSAPSAISHDTNVCKTATKNRSLRRTCWQSYLPTTSS